MFPRSPVGTVYFSPTCSEAECGVNGDIAKEVPKGRPNNLCGTLLIIICYLYRSFRTLSLCIYLNPTCRFALRWAEIFCPCGTIRCFTYQETFLNCRESSIFLYSSMTVSERAWMVSLCKLKLACLLSLANSTTGRYLFPTRPDSMK
ncbi:hypothetical protein Barb4_01798 [Bacteroidales bacterium Barb4]|nr:hypothetical protein Barb4_01798 [Bacteroidales bacterium Barb4]